MELEQQITYREEAQNCTVDIDPSVQVKNFEVVFGAKDCSLVIEPKCRFGRLSLYFLSPGASVFIGRETVCNSSLWANLLGAGKSIRFGKNCLIASVRARTSDSHHIVDLETNKTINLPGDIWVDERVWLAEDVLLLRNTKIGSNSVIGARSMVNSEIPPNCLAVGAPARVVRENISWRYSGAHLNPPT